MHIRSVLLVFFPSTDLHRVLDMQVNHSGVLPQLAVVALALHQGQPQFHTITYDRKLLLCPEDISVLHDFNTKGIDSPQTELVQQQQTLPQLNMPKFA